MMRPARARWQAPEQAGGLAACCYRHSVPAMTLPAALPLALFAAQLEAARGQLALLRELKRYYSLDLAPLP
jgi:hypothetical protein